MATTSKRLILLVAAWIMAATAVWGQSAVHWSAYKTADGLAEPVYDSVFFSPQGKLIASRNGAAMAVELDGYSVSNFPAPPGNLGRICESPGGQRWALAPSGLRELKKGGWLSHPTPESKGALAFLPVRQGTVLLLLPDRLMELLNDNVDEPKTVLLLAASQATIGDFTGMAVSHDNNLWISGTRGLVKIGGPVRNLDPKAGWQKYACPESPMLANFTRPMPAASGVTVMAEMTGNHGKTVATFDGHHWAVFPAVGHDFFCAWRGPDQTLWAATAKSLFQWSAAVTNWVEHEEISASKISDVAVEPGGDFWLATSDGLFRGSPSLWARPEAVRDLDSPVKSMTLDANGRLYFVADGRLHVLKDQSLVKYVLPQAAAGGSSSPNLFSLKDGSVLLDDGSTLALFEPNDGTFRPLPSASRGGASKSIGMLADGSVCLCSGGEHPEFETFDGAAFHGLSNPPPVQPDDGPFTCLFAARNGDLWLASGQTVYGCHESKWSRFASTDHGTPEGVVGFVEMADNAIWCATPDELWKFDGKNWSPFQSRFNHINAVMGSRNGEVWLASNGGLFRYCNGIWMENGEPEGLPNGAVNALCEDAQGQIWTGTAHGVALFHAQADLDAPQTFVRWLGESNHRLTEGGTLNLLFGGADKWKATPPDRLLYSCQLDQHGWSAFQDLTMFTLPNPAVGRHDFQVRAMDRNGNVDPITATLAFAVTAPWFRETRLWIVLLMGLAVAVFFAGVALNRHRQLVRSHAAVELKVAERTRELEIATRELLHSQKMNALGTLAAGIAHDFNNILSIIKGSAQIIEDNPGQPDKIRTRVDRIKTVVQQGAEIVDAMLGFGRGSDTAAARCDVNGVVTDTIKLLGDRFLREVEVKFERVEALPEISSSRGFIQQILLNFIFNAAEAMSKRKRIMLTTQLAEKLPPDMALHPGAAAAYIFISVRDQGVGMSPEIKARIFEPFFTTKAMSTRRGTGLGLSMVYELAKKMGAGLAVQSAEGQGSTFTLILPVPVVPMAENREPAPGEPIPT